MLQIDILISVRERVREIEREGETERDRERERDTERDRESHTFGTESIVSHQRRQVGITNGNEELLPEQWPLL